MSLPAFLPAEEHTHIYKNWLHLDNKCGGELSSSSGRKAGRQHFTNQSLVYQMPPVN